MEPGGLDPKVLMEHGTTAMVLFWLMLWVTRRLDKIIMLLHKLVPAVAMLSRSVDKLLDRVEHGRPMRARTDVRHLGFDEEEDEQ